MPKVSYRDLAPLESGGVTARNGFEFQDHVAAGYCIDMLSDETLIEVWCETLDDITIIRVNEDDEVFEFVQVKNNQFDHFWSVSDFCKRESKTENKKTLKKVNSSIFEKLFANERDNVRERCLFRMVTALEVKDDLKILKLPLDSPSRTATSDKLYKLGSEIEEKIPNYTTPNGSDIASCLLRTVWDVRHNTQAVKNENLLKLRRFSSKMGTFLTEDQWDELYAKILSQVKEAGRATWEINPESKKFKRNSFLDLVKEQANLAQHPSIGGTGNKLQEKMLKAGIPDDVIQNAKEQRISYRSRTLSSSYMDLSKQKEVEMEVRANLQQLISELDSEKLQDNGVEFHNRCLTRLYDMSTRTQDVNLSFLHGCMYNLTERCVHRFMRAGV
jgi:hypothetical protein